MDLELDLEARLRKQLAGRAVAEEHVWITINGEGRVVLGINAPDEPLQEYVIVGDTALLWPTVVATIPEKPPTQRFFASSITPTAQKGEPGYDPN